MPTKNVLQFACLTTAAILLGACDDDSTVNSDAVTSSQIFATFEIYSDGSEQIFAAAQLTKDEPPSSDSDDDIFVRLVSADKLWLSAGDNIDDIQLGDDLFSSLQQLEKTQVLMSRSQHSDSYFFNSFIFYNNVWYSGRLPQSEEGMYGVALLRENDTDAKYSSVQMPEPFAIYSPEAFETYSRNSDVLTIEWAPTENNVNVGIEINTSCLDDSFDSFTRIESEDSGMAVIDAGLLDSPYLSGECTTTVDVIKTRLGQFDSAFDGGRISAHQTRSVTITTTD